MSQSEQGVMQEIAWKIGGDEYDRGLERGCAAPIFCSPHAQAHCRQHEWSEIDPDDILAVAARSLRQILEERCPLIKYPIMLPSLVS